MIERLIRFSVTHRLIVLFSIAILIAGGAWALYKLPIDAVPDVTNVQVTVMTPAPALSPLEIERQITYTIETAMSGLPNLEEIRSVSKVGLSVVTIVFNDSTDIYFARQLINERLTQVRQQIPSHIGTPQMGPISTGLGEIYQYEVRSDDPSKFGPTDLRTIQDWIVRKQLLTVPGVTEVNSFGGLEKQFQIQVDPAKLQSYSLTLRDVLQAAETNNADAGGAYIEHDGRQYLLRGLGLAKNPEDISSIVIKTGKDGVPVFIRDVAEVVTGSALRQGAVTADGQGEITAGIVIMLKGDNSREVVSRIKNRIEDVKKSLPKGISLIPFYDREALVNRTLRTVSTNLVEGALIVIFILILLLGNWRAALLTATVIPLSMLVAAILMRAFNISGNLMSLGAIDFGLIVDGAVIMTENSVRRIIERQRNLGRITTPDELQDTIMNASLEVRQATMFGELIIMVVYLPILSLTGIEGKMFSPMAMTVIFALIGAFILSLTYVPAMLTIALKGKVAEHESRLIHALGKLYKTSLDYVLRNRRRAMTMAITPVILSIVIFPFLGAEFIPRIDEGTLLVEASNLPSVSLPQAIKLLTEAEKVIKSFPETDKVVSKIGRPEISTDPMSVDSADVHIELKPPSEWTTANSREELIEKMSHALEDKVPQIKYAFSQPIEMRTSELIAGVRSDVAIKLFGEDLEQLKLSAEKISRVVQSIRGAEDVRIEKTAGLPQIQIKPDRATIARFGINISDINDVVESLIAGKSARIVYEGEKRFGMSVKLNEPTFLNAEFPETKSYGISSIGNVLISAPNGARIPLSQLANISIVNGPAQISHDDTRRRIVIEANVRGRDIAGFVSEAKSAIDRNVKLQPGYYITWGGQFQNLERASQRLLIVVPIALALIFILLYTTFHSTRHALLIYTGIPFAIVGGVLALALRGMPFSISAGVGFIALFGVAVLNGLVMISAINRSIADGINIKDAVRSAAHSRLRPVLMTALVASLGFLPMALSTSAGAEVQRPLATVVIGGLITSTLLTLLLLPVFYLLFQRKETIA